MMKKNSSVAFEAPSKKDEDQRIENYLKINYIYLTI